MPQGSDASTYRRMAWEGKVAQYIDNNANINILKRGTRHLPKIFTAPPPWENAAPSTSCTTWNLRRLDQKQAATAFLEFLYKAENSAN